MIKITYVYEWSPEKIEQFSTTEEKPENKQSCQKQLFQGVNQSSVAAAQEKCVSLS